MSYDRKCYELAEHFMADWNGTNPNTVLIGNLAQTIQTTIEEWFEEMTRNHPELEQVHSAASIAKIRQGLREAARGEVKPYDFRDVGKKNR
jgi:hypothetical protein